MNLRDALGGVTRLPGGLAAIGSKALGQLDPGRHHRRVWSSEDRAHIEVRAVDQPGHERLASDVKTALSGLEGVAWAEVDAAVGRVVLSFDPRGLSLEDLVAVVEAVEARHGVDGEPFPRDRPDHPADIESVRRATVSFDADILGLVGSVFGRLARAAPLPVELASLVSFTEQQPRVRELVERLVGASTTDFALGTASTVAQAVTQGPVGLAVDAAHRFTQMWESQARLAAWERREPELTATPDAVATPAVVVEKRPARLQDGALERYANRTTMASLGATGVALALGTSPRRAASLVVAGLPKASRIGRETFAAALGRALARRDVIVMNHSALRRLDRIDVAVLDARAVLGPPTLGAIEAFDASAEDVHAVLAEMFEPTTPRAVARHGQWVMGPLPTLGRLGIVAPGGRTGSRGNASGTVGLLGIAYGGVVVATVTLDASVDPLGESLVATAQRAGLELALAGGPRWLRKQLKAELSVAGGRRLTDSVRTLQGSGRGVLLISVGDAYEALAEADCSLGVSVAGARGASSADLVAANGLVDGHLVVEATAAARRVSTLSAQIAAAGSIVGGLWSIRGPGAGAGRRAALAINGATLAAYVNALVSAAAVTSHPPPEIRRNWHEMDSSAVLALLETGSAGLHPEQVQRRRVVPERPPPNVLRLSRAVAAELANPLTPVLGIGAVLAATVGSVADAALVASVLGVNAVMGGVQRLRTAVSIEQLIEASSTPVTAYRSGEVAVVAREELVPGDLIQLTGGEMVPADCRVLDAEGCEVDESAMTGESLPVIKDPAPTPGAELADRSCMLYEGTTISSGRTVSVVVAVGSATEVGRSLADAPAPPPSGVETRLSSLTALTLPVTIGSGIAVTGIGLLRSRSAVQAIASGVSLMVAAVPEGLPLLASVAQRAAAGRLSTRGALVRHSRTIEALGRIDTLSFDKTGTLTQGEIRLQRVSDGADDEPIDGLGSRGRAVLAAALRASPAAGGDDIEQLPHATDRSVLAGAQAVGVTAADQLGGWKPLGQLSFDPARGFHAVVGSGPRGARVAVKGAPEVILPRCTAWSGPKGRRRLSGPVRRQLDKVVERMAGRGLRVLAVAERHSSDRAEVGEERIANMELLGFLGLADSVRPTAPTAVADLRAAGIEVVMITGDHPGTARAVGDQLGLDSQGVLTGGDLDAMSDQQLDAVIPRASVFARVTPAQKVRIVRAYQRLGRVVAMTGDGVNDAPAIRLAHAGIALGRRSSSAAREAADLVVVDNRIETILASVVEGRALWASVRDALAILIGGNLGEVAFTVAATVLAGASPLGPRQFLLVNMLTDMLPAMTTTMRPPTDRPPETLLHEGPEDSLGRPLNRQIALRAATTASGALGAWTAAHLTGRSGRANTVALVALVGTQLAQTVVVGSRSPLVLGSAAASGAVLAAIVQTPGVNRFFGSEPLDLSAWAIALGASTVAVCGSVAAGATAATDRQRKQQPSGSDQSRPSGGARARA